MLCLDNDIAQLSERHRPSEIVSHASHTTAGICECSARVCPSRLLKKSFASTGKDGVVALSKDSSTSILPSFSSSADPSPEISSQSGVDHPLPADQLAFYRDAHVDVASSLGARTRL